MAFPLIAIGAAQAGLGLYNTIAGQAAAARAQRRAQQMLANRPQATIAPAIQGLFNDAQATRNAVSPYLIQARADLQQAAADRNAQAERAATSGSEALSVGAATQAGLNRGYGALTAQQQEYAQQQRVNLQQASAMLAQEQQRVQQDQLDAYGDRLNYTIGQGQAGQQRVGQGLGMLAQGAFSIASPYMNPTQTTQLTNPGSDALANTVNSTVTAMNPNAAAMPIQNTGRYFNPNLRFMMSRQQGNPLYGYLPPFYSGLWQK